MQTEGGSLATGEARTPRVDEQETEASFSDNDAAQCQSEVDNESTEMTEPCASESDSEGTDSANETCPQRECNTDQDYSSGKRSNVVFRSNHNLLQDNDVPQRLYNQLLVLSAIKLLKMLPFSKWTREIVDTKLFECPLSNLAQKYASSETIKGKSYNYCDMIESAPTYPGMLHASVDSRPTTSPGATIPLSPECVPIVMKEFAEPSQDCIAILDNGLSSVLLTYQEQFWWVFNPLPCDINGIESEVQSGRAALIRCGRFDLPQYIKSFWLNESVPTLHIIRPKTFPIAV